ncbi:MAG: protein kinase [Planctomycetes bacterium]|nr:protein kinase [Planctomycetota bacterium]
MEPHALEKLIHDVANGTLSPEAAAERLREGAAPPSTLLNITPGESSALPVLGATASTRVLAKEQGGPRIGQYRILKEHARGGMGRVLLAVDTSIGRKVALKELLSGASQDGSGENAATHSIGERFLREARITGRLEHPNIVPVYEIGDGENGPYYSMRFVAGHTLAQKLVEINSNEDPRERLAARLQLLDAFYDVCNAIAYAHSKGVIHRDLKPSNIMLGEFGETVVLDWGLARVQGEDNPIHAGSIIAADSADSSQLTLDGDVIGTPSYMPPEQARGELDEVDELSDVYSLGAVLYEILSGSAPYVGGNPISIVKRVVAEPPVPLAEIEPAAPPELVVLCARAMARAKSERLPAALQFAREVKAFRDGKTLQSYEYSSLELIQRFLKRQWKLVSVSAVALIAVAIVSGVAIDEVISERNTARAALDKATEEEARRIAAEESEARKAQEMLDSREAAISRTEEVIAGYDADLLLRDLFTRVESYGVADANFRLESAERERNRALITAVLGYASQLKELVRLQTVEGVQPTDRVADQTQSLRKVQTALVELAVQNADFELASYLLAGSELPDETIARLNAGIADRETQLLDWRAGRILSCLDDARSGLRREARPAGAPTLTQYVRELAGFQDDQTIRMLSTELEQLALRLRGLGRPVGVAEFDMAHLLCATLGRLQKPTATVPQLAKFLARQTHPRMIEEAVSALSETQHPSGTQALIEEALRRDFLFIEDHRRAFASAYKTSTSSNLLRGILAFARQDQLACIGLLENEEGVLPAVMRAVSLLALERTEEARNLLDALNARYPDTPSIHIAYGRIDQVNWDAGPYRRAVNMAPDSARILRERAEFCRHRLVEQAIEDALALTNRWPDVVEHWQLLGDAYRDVGRFENALPAYRRAVEVDPDFAEAWLFLGVTYRSLDKINEAYDTLETAVRLAPDRSHALAKLGEIEFFRFDYPRCIELTSQAVAIDETEQDAWYYQGLAYLRMREGNEHLLEVVNARASNPFERGNMEKAIEAFRGLVRVVPSNYRAWALMATTLTALGRDDEAREAIRSADALAFLHANTVGMGTQLLRECEIWMDARNSLTAVPESTDQLLGAALCYANEAYQAWKIENQRELLRAALGALDSAEGKLGETPSRIDQVKVRRVRRAIASAMRRTGFYQAIGAVISPVIAEEPEWIAMQDQFDLAESLVGLAYQYQEDEVLFLGSDEAERLRMEAELDALTGAKRKQISDELRTAGLSDFVRLAQEGFEHVHGGTTQLTNPYRDDPLRLQARDVFARNHNEASFVRMNPYAVLVIASIARRMQADALGLQQFDVIHRIGDRQLKAPTGVGPAITAAAKNGEYEMVVHRYERDEAGQPVQARGADGSPVYDERGNPVLKFQELVFHPKVGILGIGIETGYLPHPLDR